MHPHLTKLDLLICYFTAGALEGGQSTFTLRLPKGCSPQNAWRTGRLFSSAVFLQPGWLIASPSLPLMDCPSWVSSTSLISSLIALQCVSLRPLSASAFNCLAVSNRAATRRHHQSAFSEFIAFHVFLITFCSTTMKLLLILIDI